MQPARACSFQRPSALPMLSISIEDAEYLRRLQLRKGTVRLRLTLDSQIELRES